jgi:N-acetylglucosaminyldiphosphoundecaprenol N-acetyl-beta-D-mannosaminyltransferase
MTATSDCQMLGTHETKLDQDHVSTAARAAGDHSFTAHESADVLGVKVSAINMQNAVEFARQWIERARPGYVCVSSVHVVMEAQRQPEVFRALNRAAMNTPDGMPLAWVGRLQGFTKMDRVFGPELMMEICRISVERGYRHFLYGGKPGVAGELREKLQERFPGIEVVGASGAKYGTLSPHEQQDLVQQIRQAKPHIVWVGLGAPYQELFMAKYVDRLKVPLLVGVGAAFDFHTGRVRDCSPWIKRAGLQWLHRLMQEPKRLWKRYLTNVPAFLWHIAIQMCGPRWRRARWDAL